MASMRLFVLILFAFTFLIRPSYAQVPPYSGTIFVDSNIIVSTDPSAYSGMQDAGQRMVQMFDRRINNWAITNAFIFTASYDDGLSIDVQVNPEFGSLEVARSTAVTYARYVGQLPNALRRDVDALWIHQGVELFGGGNRSILIHTGQSANYLASGILEETLIHEAAHTSLDLDYASSPGWLQAQAADPTFISTYARDNPLREDVAESFIFYLALKFRRDRMNASTISTIEQTIPNRLAFFEGLSLNLYPFSSTSTGSENGNVLPSHLKIESIYPNPISNTVNVAVNTGRAQPFRLSILDLLGRKVIESLLMAPGMGPIETTLDTSQLPSGAYFIHLESSNGTDTKPVVIL